MSHKRLGPERRRSWDRWSRSACVHACVYVCVHVYVCMRFVCCNALCFDISPPLYLDMLLKLLIVNGPVLTMMVMAVSHGRNIKSEHLES